MATQCFLQYYNNCGTQHQGYGGSLVYDGQYIVNHTNIILVTINYRIGALGFLVYGSKLEIGGNYGLKVYTQLKLYMRICYGLI